MELTGILKDKFKPQSGVSQSGKEWIKQDFIIDTQEKYDNIIAFNVFGQEKVDLLSQVNIGESVTVAFNIKCREYNGKYYTNLDAWKVDRAGSSEPQAGSTVGNPDDNDEELPF